MKNFNQKLVASLIAILCSFFFSITPVQAEDWVPLTTEEVKELFTETQVSWGQGQGGGKVKYGTVPGCGMKGKRTARYIDFHDDGGYDWTEKGETRSTTGVEKKGKKYRWRHDQTNFSVKPLKEKHIKKTNKRLAEKLPEKCVSD